MAQINRFRLLYPLLWIRQTLQQSYTSPEVLLSLFAYTRTEMDFEYESNTQAFYIATDTNLTGKTIIYDVLNCSSSVLLWVVNETKTSLEEKQDSDYLRDSILAISHLQLQDISSEMKAAQKALLE